MRRDVATIVDILVAARLVVAFISGYDEIVARARCY